MAAKYWIKAWLEILDDAKMGLLSDRQWRRAVELMLYAGELGDSGDLPDSQRIAWRLRCDPGVLAEDLAVLSEVRIVIPRDGGGWLVRKFAERQAPVSASERSRQYRARKAGGARGYSARRAREGARHVSFQDPVTKRDERGSGDPERVTFRGIESDTDTDLGRRPRKRAKWLAGEEPTELGDKWGEVQEALRLQMPAETFNAWLATATLVAIRDDAWVVGVRSQAAAEWLELRCAGILARTFERVLGEGLAWPSRAVEFEVAGS